MKNFQRIAATAAVMGLMFGSAWVASSQAVLTRGFLNVDRYDDVGDGLLASDLLVQAKFPDSPDAQFLTTKAGVDQTSPDLSNFGVRITGWVQPPTTGQYTFFLRSDDGSEFFINETAGGDPPDPFFDLSAAVELDCCDAYQEPEILDLATSVPIQLTAGQRYGITILMKEAGGGDYVYVAWRLAGDTTPAADLQPIPGAYLWGMVDPTGRSFSIVQQPQSQTVIEERTAAVSIAIETQPNPGEYSVQWLKDGQPIPGANGNTYRTPVLAVGDDADYVAEIITVFGTTNSATAAITVVPDTFPPVPSAGAIVSSDGTTVDVGVGFDEQIDDTAAAVASNYSISQGTITSFNYYPKSQSALLKVTGLTPGASATVTVQNVEDVKGNAITSANAQVTVSSTISWGVIGGGEGPGGVAGNYVVPVDDGGFDVYSNGVGEWAAYDEATFVYEEITGDFDKKAQVIYQDLSSQWARAGIVVRDVTNFGVNRAAQEGGQSGRYQKVHVNPSGPTLTGPGTAGNNAWEGNRRLRTGGQTDAAGGGGGPLDYPNCWVRLQRSGQVFTIYRSLDGENWTQLGSTEYGVILDGTEPTLPMPDTVFVGPEFSPENNNITNEGDRGVWLAQIRNYGDTFSVGPPGPLSISLSGGSVEISWPGSGVLQRTDAIGGTWSDINSPSPYTATEEGFYRLRSAN